MDDFPSVVLTTDSPDTTRRAAGAIAALLREGDVVALSGDLGAGKTCFVQGAAAALGVEQRVTSPTFVLVRYYPEARVPIVHCDVYRLDELTDVDGLGDEVMAEDVVTFLEWSDAVQPLLPEDRLEVELLLVDGEDDDRRRIVVSGLGPGWAGRWDSLANAVRTWTT